MSSNSIYLVMDMQNDLVNGSGPKGHSLLSSQAALREIVPKTVNAIRKARAAGLRIGFVRVGFSSDYRECPDNSPIFKAAKSNGIFKLGTWGTEIHPELTPIAEDLLITKHRVSPFYGTNLEPILRANGISRIYASGVSTNGVVQAVVREGHDRDYEVIVLEDCCAAISPEEHTCSINGLGRYCFVTNSMDIEFK